MQTDQVKWTFHEITRIFSHWLKQLFSYTVCNIYTLMWLWQFAFKITFIFSCCTRLQFLSLGSCLSRFIASLLLTMLFVFQTMSERSQEPSINCRTQQFLLSGTRLLEMRQLPSVISVDNRKISPLLCPVGWLVIWMTEKTLMKMKMMITFVQISLRRHPTSPQTSWHIQVPKHTRVMFVRKALGGKTLLKDTNLHTWVPHGPNCTRVMCARRGLLSSIMLKYTNVFTRARDRLCVTFVQTHLSHHPYLPNTSGYIQGPFCTHVMCVMWDLLTWVLSLHTRKLTLVRSTLYDLYQHCFLCHTVSVCTNRLRCRSVHFDMCHMWWVQHSSH